MIETKQSTRKVIVSCTGMEPQIEGFGFPSFEYLLGGFLDKNPRC